jgi:hypothetical protein
MKDEKEGVPERAIGLQSHIARVPRLWSLRQNRVFTLDHTQDVGTRPISSRVAVDE